MPCSFGNVLTALRQYLHCEKRSLIHTTCCPRWKLTSDLAIRERPTRSERCHYFGDDDVENKISDGNFTRTPFCDLQRPARPALPQSRTKQSNRTSNVSIPAVLDDESRSHDGRASRSSGEGCPGRPRG